MPCSLRGSAAPGPGRIRDFCHGLQGLRSDPRPGHRHRHLPRRGHRSHPQHDGCEVEVAGPRREEDSDTLERVRPEAPPAAPARLRAADGPVRHRAHSRSASSSTRRDTDSAALRERESFSPTPLSLHATIENRSSYPTSRRRLRTKQRLRTGPSAPSALLLFSAIPRIRGAHGTLRRNYGASSSPIATLPAGRFKKGGHFSSRKAFKRTTSSSSVSHRHAWIAQASGSWGL